MQAYGRSFAYVYNKRWTGFAHRVAPLIAEFYASTGTGEARYPVLDLCCGTGQLALHFLEQGYRVTGLDLSEYMLQYASENASSYVESGQAQFVRADASEFSLDQQFGLVASTFDALNHLDGPSWSPIQMPGLRRTRVSRASTLPIYREPPARALSSSPGARWMAQDRRWSSLRQTRRTAPGDSWKRIPLSPAA